MNIASLVTKAKALPMKLWLYVALLAAASIGIAVFIHHERKIGQQKLEADMARAKAETAEKVRNETLALAPYLDKYNGLNESLKNNAPPIQTDFACASAPDAVVHRANAH